MLTAVHQPGLVLQGGLDVRLWRSVHARLDVKLIALMMARAEVHHVEVETPGLPRFLGLDLFERQTFSRPSSSRPCGGASLPERPSR